MNGLEKITARIDADVQAEIDRATAQAQAQADAITAEYRAKAEKEAADLAERNKKAAEDRLERLVSVAHMESRKVTLGAKQKMVDAAFDRALEKLCALPEAEYVGILATLLVKAASTGREEVIFSPQDRERVGKAAVAQANAALAKEVAPELPEELSNSKVGALLNKVATGVSALAAGTAQLTLSQETRPIQGGFILKDGNVEVNCTFDTLVRLQRTEIAGAVANILFG